jgi:hypothetical protein
VPPACGILKLMLHHEAHPGPSLLSLAPSPAPTQATRSFAGRIAGGFAVLLLAVMTMGVGITEVLQTTLDPGAVGALLFMAGMAVVGGLMIRSGLLAHQADIRATEGAIEHALLTFAYARGGRLTVPQVSLCLCLPLEQARGTLDRLVIKGAAEPSVDEEGAMVYTFPGLHGASLPLVRPLPRVVPPPLAAVRMRAPTPLASSTVSSIPDGDEEELLVHLAAAPQHRAAR